MLKRKNWSSNVKLQLAVAIVFIPFPLIGESPVIDSFSIYELVVSFFWFASHGKYGRRKRNSRRRGNKNSFESSCSVLDLDLNSRAEEVLIMFFFSSFRWLIYSLIWRSDFFICFYC
ncbi:unnamed protein product [Malus baccata var. baccata]